MTDEPVEAEPGLKQNAIGFVDALVIGLASTAPAYSLAAVLGIVVVIAGVQAPAVLLASFVPMFFIAAAFFYMNRADQDCGTTFSWVTRTLGPWPGWMGGWAICTTGILVVGSLADVAARYFYVLIGADGAADSKAAVMALAVAIIAVMTLVCVLGTDLSARLQNILIGAQVGALLLFAAVALYKVWFGDAPEGSIEPSLSWLSPLAIDSTSALVAGLLTGVFIYWGWESAVNLTEEVEDSASAPGRAAVLSTVILVVTYVAVGVAVVAFAGLDRIAEFEDDDTIFSTLATDVLGTPWDQIVVIAVLTSALASTQTTILPASRTTLSMARAKAMPAALAHIHPRYLTPHVSTWIIGALATLWYVVANSLSENFLFDTLSALSLMIAFYYALSGIACVVYYRRELTKSVKQLPLHRRRARRRRAHPGLPADPLGDRPVRPGGLLLGHRGARRRRAAGHRRGVPRAGRGDHGGLVGGRPPQLLRAPPVRGAAARLRARRRRRGAGRGPGGEALMAAGVVLGFDDSEGSRAALEAAIEVAGVLGEPLHIAFAAAPPTMVGEESAEHRRALEEMGGGLLQEALAAARAAGVDVHAHLAPERPVDLLLRLADEHDARMIVVGTYGESPLRGAILGATPHKLLHLSSRPVLTVPAR